VNGRIKWLNPNGGYSVWQGIIQLPKTEKDWRVRPHDGWEDYSRPVHDNTRRDGRRGREDRSRFPIDRRGSRTPQAHKEASEMARRKEGSSFSGPRRRAEILESLDRRHGRKTGRDSRIHGGPQREGWEQRRYNRRSGRFGLSRRFLNRQEMEI